MISDLKVKVRCDPRMDRVPAVTAQADLLPLRDPIPLVDLNSRQMCITSGKAVGVSQLDVMTVTCIIS